MPGWYDTIEILMISKFGCRRNRDSIFHKRHRLIDHEVGVPKNSSHSELGPTWSCGSAKDRLSLTLCYRTPFAPQYSSEVAGWGRPYHHRGGPFAFGMNDSSRVRFWRL